MMMTAVARFGSMARVFLETASDAGASSASGNASGALAQVFTMLQTCVTGFTDVMMSVFSNSVRVLWDGTNLTFIGALSLCGLAIGLFYFGFRFIRKLIKLKG